MSDDHTTARQIATLITALVKLALQLGMPKHHLYAIISTEYDLERNNRRSPQ